MPAADSKLQIVICKRFGELAAIIAPSNIQRDRIDGFAHEPAHEGEFLFRREFPEDAVAFASDMDRDLIRH